MHWLPHFCHNVHSCSLSHSSINIKGSIFSVFKLIYCIPPLGLNKSLCDNIITISCIIISDCVFIRERMKGGETKRIQKQGNVAFWQKMFIQSFPIIDKQSLRIKVILSFRILDFRHNKFMSKCTFEISYIFLLAAY